MIDNKKLYIITWIDSYNHISSWEDIEELPELTDMVCVSVGWIQEENESYIRIIPHITDINNKNYKGHSFGAMAIPKVAILKRINLKFNN